MSDVALQTQSLAGLGARGTLQSLDSLGQGVRGAPCPSLAG